MQGGSTNFIRVSFPSAILISLKTNIGICYDEQGGGGAKAPVIP